MSIYKVSERTMAMLPQLIAKAGITNPIVGVEETKTLVKVYLLAHQEPVVIRKPKPPASTKPKARQTAGKRKAQP